MTDTERYLATLDVCDQIMQAAADAQWETVAALALLLAESPR